MKSANQKKLLLEQLRKIPIVQLACDKCSIGRATYYRWLKKDPDFAKQATEAIQDGSLLINDLSETQLLSLIREKNFSAIAMWLRHHHPNYSNKLELSGQIQTSEELTPEQASLVREALRLASINDTNSSDAN